MPFLTQLDSRAAIKGSRDPLGVQAIWSRLGRTLIGNLTTVSNEVRDFTITLLGYYLAERVAEDTGKADDLGVFIRWEQLASYARGGINGSWGFRGTERVKSRWAAQTSFTLGLDADSLILSDQKTYGLWGLYTVPSRSSGLIGGTPSRLTPETRRFVEELYLPGLDGRRGARAEAIAGLLASTRVDFRPAGRHKSVIESVARVLKPKIVAREAEFFHEYLVLGGPADSTGGAQASLARALRPTSASDTWTPTPASMRALARACRNDRDEAGAVAAVRLERVIAAESVLAPAVSLFGFVLASKDQDLATLIREVRREWPARLDSVQVDRIAEHKSDLIDASGEPSSAERWLGTAESLAKGEYGDAIERLIAQNEAVMNQRGGSAPWVELSQGKVKVKLAVETAVLPDRKAMNNLWVHPYFVESLRGIQMQLEV